jgi:hypothetical protein
MSKMPCKKYLTDSQKLKEENKKWNKYVEAAKN